MTCKLCLQDKQLLKKSHIIPNFMYGDLFDGDHSLFKVRLSDWSKQKLQTGEYEANILCANCDNKLIGGLENYACQVLYGGKINGVEMRNEINQNGVEFTYAKGIDYKKFKLFLLSLVWRCSISKRVFYKQVELGQKHEETIRAMIYGGDPGKQMDYPCFISSYRKHNELPAKVISQPTKFRHDGGVAYSIILGGIVYMYYISKHSVPQVISETVINEHGELKIVHMPLDQAKNLLNHYTQHRVFPV
ncbi:MAG: hypothetical protein NUV53_03115 [Patescibacteria group bacterium]|nr:hypothetical protein [Patescibacteria group bacterium]